MPLLHVSGLALPGLTVPAAGGPVPAVSPVVDRRLRGLRRDLPLAGSGRGRRRRQGRRCHRLPAEVHVGAGVEGLGAVRALPDAVDQVPAGPLGDGAVEDVAPGVQRGVGDLGERLRFQVRPLQRLPRVVAVLREVQLERAAVRGRRPVAEGVLARGQLRPRPVGARQVQSLVLVAAGAAQLAVRDDPAVAPGGVTDVDLVPVVERLGAAGRDHGLAGGRARMLGPLGETRGHSADGIRHGAVRHGGCGGQRGERERGEAEQGYPQGGVTHAHGGSPSEWRWPRTPAVLWGVPCVRGSWGVEPEGGRGRKSVSSGRPRTPC